jgi:hypothetical protein
MKILYRKTLLTFIRNSMGTSLFKNFIVEEDGETKDLLMDGSNSCALYVSTLLSMSKLLDTPRKMVDHLEEDLQAHGWRLIDTPRVGAVIIWAAQDNHRHVGFCVSKEKAVSNRSSVSVPGAHSIDFDGQRRIESIYWNDHLADPP